VRLPNQTLSCLHLSATCRYICRNAQSTQAAAGCSDGLFFGDGGQPFNRGQVVRRATRAWKAAGLEPIGLHECRHTFASLMIAAGVNAKALATYLGHSSIQITLDRYGHLMPGNESEAAELLDAYLTRAEKAVTHGSLAAPSTAEVRDSRGTVRASVLRS
jgi:integrase